MRKNKLLLLLVLLMTAATGAWAQDAKHLITAKYREQTRSLEQPLPYATTIGELYEAVSGQSFSDLISSMSGFEMPLTGISSNNTSAVIGELNGASTPVTVIADGKATISINFGSYAHGIFVSAVSPLYANMKDGVKDADKWTVKVGEGQAQALPIGGLTGDGSETVTLQYNGRLKVKGVKATSDAAAPAVPDGAISGVFSVSDGKQVYFSKGNLRYASSKWSFFDNQYDYNTSYSADAWDHFGWSTSATTYGMNTSTSNGDYSGDFVDWGATMGTGWFTLTSAEWTYLFNNRSASSVNGTENGRYAKAKVNGVQGVILFPDTYTHPDGVNAPTGVNATDDTGWNGNSYTVADWTKMESAGCVFLPAAGMRLGTSMSGLGSNAYYWSATPNGPGNVYDVYISSYSLATANFGSRIQGLSVRLVQEATSEAEQSAKPAATVTTAPTAKTGVKAGQNEAIVNEGAAEGGTMMYMVNATQPASTDGFSATVPTAEGLTAGTYYVWYYVKADDSHTDSEISASGIEVTIAAAAPALNLTSPAVGQVIGDDGKNYDYASLPGGVTAVAKICYVSGEHGLALALTDESSAMNWDTAKTTCAAHTPALTGGTWKLATQGEWTNMISGAGGFATLRDGFEGVGGYNLQELNYWSSTEQTIGARARACNFNNGNWSNIRETNTARVRACLAF